jgi:hypothetical protein
VKTIFESASAYNWLEVMMSESVAVLSGSILDYNRVNMIFRSILKERTRLLFTRYSVDSVILEGDSFQIVMKDPQDVIRMVLEMRAMLKQLVHSQHPKGLDIRVSIGLGDHDEHQIEISRFTQAWVRSNAGLDDLASRNGRMGVNTGIPESDALIGATMRLLDRVVASWSESQASAMEYTLQGMTQHQIADILHITQPSVNNRLKLAQWNEIEHLIEVWESFVVQKSNMEYVY